MWPTVSVRCLFAFRCMGRVNKNSIILNLVSTLARPLRKCLFTLWNIRNQYWGLLKMKGLFEIKSHLSSSTVLIKSSFGCKRLVAVSTVSRLLNPYYLYTGELKMSFDI